MAVASGPTATLLLTNDTVPPSSDPAGSTNPGYILNFSTTAGSPNSLQVTYDQATNSYTFTVSGPNDSIAVDTVGNSQTGIPRVVTTSATPTSVTVPIAPNRLTSYLIDGGGSLLLPAGNNLFETANTSTHFSATIQIPVNGPGKLLSVGDSLFLGVAPQTDPGIINNTGGIEATSGILGGDTIVAGEPVTVDRGVILNSGPNHFTPPSPPLIVNGAPLSISPGGFFDPAVNAGGANQFVVDTTPILSGSLSASVSSTSPPPLGTSFTVLSTTGNAALTPFPNAPNNSVILGSDGATLLRANYVPYTGTTTSGTNLVLSPVTVAVALAPSSQTVTYGTPYTFAAGVTSSTGTSAVPVAGGTITLTDDAGLPLGSPVPSNQSTIAETGTELPPGTYKVFANYTNIDGAQIGTPAEVLLTVKPAPVTTTLTAAPASPIGVGDPVTLTATVSPPPSGTSLTGQVAFLDGSTVLGTVPATSPGDYTLTTALPQGPQVVTANYINDPYLRQTNTPTVSYQVDARTTTSAPTITPSPAVQGDQVTLSSTVAIAGLGAGSPAGSVDFLLGGLQGTLIGTAPLSPSGATSSVATLTTSALPIGSSQVFATYRPAAGAAFFGSSSTGSSQTTLPKFIVVNTLDDGPGSLRRAILDADQVPGQTISFQIPPTLAAGPQGLFSIVLRSPLPAITNRTIIDGDSEARFLGLSPTTPLIQVDGRVESPQSEGLVFAGNSAGSVLQGISIFGFAASQVEVDSANVLVRNCYVGIPAQTLNSVVAAAVNPSGSDPGSDGILIRGANATIGGLASSDRNVVSGNLGNGIEFAGTGATNGLVVGNIVGLDPTRTSGLPNRLDGIVVAGGAGSETIGPGNVVSGNAGVGIELYATSGNRVYGNSVGTNGTGTSAVEVALGNGDAGICLDVNASGNTIGGSAPGQGNVLSGNKQSGLAIQSGSSGNLVEFNKVGLDASGTFGIPNQVGGILIRGASGNTIGSGNVVSGNVGNGVELIGASRNIISGDLIGTDVLGTVAIGNGGSGICLDLGSNNNTIGGTSPGQGNVLSGNKQSGLAIQSGSSGNLVQSNIVGLNAVGTSGIGNQVGGILINRVSGNTIGTGNVVSGNVGNGIELIGASRNTISGDLIGTDPTGHSAQPNSGSGICLDLGSTGNTIGGTSSSDVNVISGNKANGIAIQSGSDDNAVLYSRIGTNKDGTAPLANLQSGILINATSGNMVGPGDVLSGNGAFGIELLGGSRNTVAGDFIGTNLGGSEAIANVLSGVCIEAGASGNTIGGSALGATNVISGNKVVGVAIQQPSTGNTIASNLIGTDATGTKPLGNGIAGVLINDAVGNIVGPGNVVSANGKAMPGAGIWIDGPAATGNLVFGNEVGTTFGGEGPLGNTSIGILINQGTGNTIGGSAFGASNVVSGNSVIGVMIAGPTASHNVIAGNLIGTDALGRKAIGNGTQAAGAGVYLDNAPGNTIGGAGAADGNLISGNPFDGVEFFGPATTNDLLIHNRIGTDALGTGRLGNGQDGVLLNLAPGNQIVENLIDANGRNGIFLSGSSNVLVQGNRIGQGLGGEALGNGTFGILVASNSKGLVDTNNVNVNNRLGPKRDTDASPVASGSGSTAQSSSTSSKVKVRIQSASHSFGSRRLARSSGKARTK